MDVRHNIKLDPVESYKEEKPSDPILPRQYKRIIIGEKAYYFKWAIIGWKQLTKDEEDLLRRMNIL